MLSQDFDWKKYIKDISPKKLLYYKKYFDVDHWKKLYENAQTEKVPLPNGMEVECKNMSAVQDSIKKFFIKIQMVPLPKKKKTIMYLNQGKLSKIIFQVVTKRYY